MSLRNWVSLVMVALVVTLEQGCKRTADPHLLRVGASPVPHAVVLAHVRPVLAAQGITLEVVTMSDFVQPNVALAEGDLEANFFQHEPYLARFNAERHARLVSVARVHVEPLGLYSHRVHALGELREGAVVSLPNDPTNEARALRLLRAAGLVELAKAAADPTVRDVTANPRKLTFRELEAAQLPRTLDDVDAAVINTNYALAAGLAPERDALAREGSDSPFANVLVVRPELAGDARVAALVKALQSDDVRAFLEKEYKGAIVPAF